MYFPACCMYCELRKSLACVEYCFGTIYLCSAAMSMSSNISCLKLKLRSLCSNCINVSIMYWLFSLLSALVY